MKRKTALFTRTVLFLLRKSWCKGHKAKGILFCHPDVRKGLMEGALMQQILHCVQYDKESSSIQYPVSGIQYPVSGIRHS